MGEYSTAAPWTLSTKRITDVAVHHQHRAVEFLHKSALSRLDALDYANTCNKCHLTLGEPSLGCRSFDFSLYSAAFGRIFVFFVFINLVRAQQSLFWFCQSERHACFGPMTAHVGHIQPIMRRHGGKSRPAARSV